MVEASERPNWTDEIRGWSLDAAEDAEASRYYWKRDAVSGLENGAKAIIIGRKGTGKTALVRYLTQSTKVPGAQTCNFELQDFGVFHKSPKDMQKSELDTDLFARWQITILREIAKLMLHSRNIDGGVRRELAKAIDRDPSELLNGEAEVTVSQRAGISIMGQGVAAGQRTETRQSAQSVSERARAFSDYLCDHIDGSTYFVLIDGVDSNYTPVTDALGEEYFLAYARALIRAVLSIRRAFAATNRAKVFPIVAVRSDIYRRIKDNDKGKWEDLLVDLRWSEHELEHLADFRVARMQDRSIKHYEAQGSFSKIYKAQTYKRKRIFSHLCESSFLRPRDVISFTRLSFDHSTWPIANAAMPYLFSKHSSYLRQEVVDEAHVTFPAIESMFSTLETCAKPKLAFDDIKANYFATNQTSLEEALRLCVQYNVLGVMRQKSALFAYQDDNVRPVQSSTFVVHPGLRPSLGIEA
ncbi:MAG: hypothetical protein ABL889_21075 [Terricaulis sp.]